QAVGRDITKRRLAEEKLKEALREKGVLLREIHHRVKSNLAVISGLLNLKSRQLNDHSIKDTLQELRNRVMSMSLIHDLIFQSDSLADIDLQQYLVRLADFLRETYLEYDQPIILEIRAHGVFMDIDRAVPCALIVTELLSNSFKHAFPDGRPGRISVEARYTRAGLMEISVHDNGVGLPENFSWYRDSSLGLNLVKSLTENQLQGRIDFDRQAGAKFTLVFQPAEHPRV
ncbi:MAG: histidine kinase, partial [Deltaproteobacteria bacterium]|nr:histidine kinase [Deltaproteobacteria bacterium]